MDKSLRFLCDSLKKIASLLKPQNQPLSFILLTGKVKQGKSTLLRQSGLTHYATDSDVNAQFFYNNQGVVLELGEAWLNQSDSLIGYTLKQLNRCHKNLKISGIMLCIDASELMLSEPQPMLDLCKAQIQLLNRFGQELGYRVNTALVFTKLDALAGFCDFFESNHASDLINPLGFSLGFHEDRQKLIQQSRHRFDLMIEVLGQQIINKLHPARSSLKRTLIREFPLQLTNLRVPVQALVQSLSLKWFRLKAIYYTSAEQGGVSVDKLNRKIQNEYSLTVQDKFPQSSNYKSYFIEGALLAFQEQTKVEFLKLSNLQKMAILSSALITGLFIVWIVFQHTKTSEILDETSKELIQYETLNANPDYKASAIYHLSMAASKLQEIPPNLLSIAIVKDLKEQITHNATIRLKNDFFPEVLKDLEVTILDGSKSQFARYQALKVYLMLGEPEHYNEQEVTQWFKENWRNNLPNKTIENKLTLLQSALKQPRQPIAINQQLVSDVRNYLNALPATYLYYSLAKNNFHYSSTPIKIKGFELFSQEIPFYYTKVGFKEFINQLPILVGQLKKENWVLARQDLNQLQEQLQEAYCFEYVTWWNNFIQKTKPIHYLTYQEARDLTQILYQNDSLSKLFKLIQEQISPELDQTASLFNQKIANQFTSLNFVSASAISELTPTIQELEKFLTTLSLVNDGGQTAFELTKSRFQNPMGSDPLSNLYNKTRQLPEPLTHWIKQIADDTWYLFISDTKTYLNQQWSKMVYQEYKMNIFNRYPLDPTQTEEVDLNAFNHFFAPHGTLNNFASNYLKPFLETSSPQWQPKEVNGYIMPISTAITDELIRANVITNMFFTKDNDTSQIEFSLQKINLDPVVANLQLTIGNTTLTDNQGSESFTEFKWPDINAKLNLDSIEGNHYELEETGPWAFFKMLQKVNVLVDNEDSASLQILFEVNGNSGRYLLKTQNPINPFSPGILTGFILPEAVA